jgi:hypothetical protein
MHPNDLEGVEVYPDAALAPSQYGGVASNGCSIILLWTRDGYVDEDG